MATLVDIDDVARDAKATAEHDGLPLARFVEDAVLRVVPDRRVHGRTTGPVVIPTFQGGGVVDGLTLEQAVERPT